MNMVSSTRGRSLPPPYGPTAGMMQGLQLLQRGSVTRVDEAMLRTHGIAPGNEYKVVGALRFLGVIDGQGDLTERSRVLKTRGSTFLLALQDLVKEAYHGLLAAVDLRQVNREDLYNYFVTEMGVGPEMAVKAVRFFLSLCRMAELELSPALTASSLRRSWSAAPGLRRPRSRPTARPRTRGQAQPPFPVAKGDEVQSPFPIILAITPQIVEMEEEQLIQLFRKMRTAFQRAFAEEDTSFRSQREGP